MENIGKRSSVPICQHAIIFLGKKFTPLYCPLNSACNILDVNLHGKKRINIIRQLYKIMTNLCLYLIYYTDEEIKVIANKSFVKSMVCVFICRSTLYAVFYFIRSVIVETNEFARFVSLRNI